MKIIKINKCFEECPHCTGPDYDRNIDGFAFTCQEEQCWIEDENTIPDWCTLEDAEGKDG